MSVSDIRAILRRIEAELAMVVDLNPQAQQAIEDLLNLVEHLAADQETLLREVERLKQQLDGKKQARITRTTDENKANKDHSSEKRRKQGDKKPRSAGDRRSFKDLTIHETIECPVDPATLPPDAVRVEDESVIVQDIKIQPHNILFQRSVYYSPAKKKRFRGPLPSGYDIGDFSANLRALILSLKYCGNMSEPKIREFLENFAVEISAGSISNILTNTAAAFEQEFDDIVRAGLAATPYQQTDDTSARVKGAFWHTHILCSPFYAAYFTRPHKDRLTVLEVLQNTSDLHFRLGAETLELLRAEFDIPQKWQHALEQFGEFQLDKAALANMLDDWFGNGNQQVRTAIEHAAAIVYYRHQTSMPVVETIVCDDAGQFKLLTKRLALCWIHAGRHYAKLSPVVPRHAKLLESFLDRYWNFYRRLQRYRASPTDEQATLLRLEFDELFASRTGYAALDDRIAKTAAKKDELLTVLSVPSVPLHNNESELGARVSARRRDVSLHSKSIRGAHAMDIFTTLVQTCKKLHLSAYAYLGDRLSHRFALTPLALQIRATAGY